MKGLFNSPLFLILIIVLLFLVLWIFATVETSTESFKLPLIHTKERREIVSRVQNRDKGSGDIGTNINETNTYINHGIKRATQHVRNAIAPVTLSNAAQTANNVATQISPPRPGQGGLIPHQGRTSRGELICKQTMERIYNKTFMSVRPPWLINHETGEPLELDVYNDELLIAVEYNGDYHYKKDHHFHRGNPKNFYDLVFRDELKKKLCKELGIHLIIVPYTVPFNDIAAYIRKRLPAR